MRRGYVLGIGFLAAVWGASYLFIKVAVDEIEPAPMMWLRTTLAAVLLAGFLAWRSGARQAARGVAAAWRPGLVLGIVNAAVPFTLIAWGEKHIDSGVAAIANASVPIFVVLLALRFRPEERVDGLRLLGVAIGFAGVAVLAGAQPEGGWMAVAGTMAVVVASLSYAAGALYGSARAKAVSAPVLATASMLAASLVLLPLAVLQAPHRMPGLVALGAVAALGVLGTAAAQLVLYRMLRLYGSARTTLVTYVMPPTAVLYGVVLLGEPLSLGVLLGVALILPGVALGSGAVRAMRRRWPVTTSP